MIGFVLCAGLGTRLRPITDHIPKALVTVCGIPLVEHAVRYLRQHGIARIGANMHHHAEQLEEYAESHELGLMLHHERSQIRGTGGALHFAREFLSEERMFCICNADIILTADLRRLADTFDRSGCITALVATPSDSEGSIRYDAESGEYLGARSETRAGIGADFTGLALYRREFLEMVTEDDFSVVPIWQRAREHGHSVMVLLERGMYWKDTGTPQRLAQLHFDALDGACRIDMNENNYVDWEQRRAYPLQLSHDLLGTLGPYTWCNSSRIDRGASIQRCVVLENSVIDSGAEISGAIVTPWGVIDCG